MPNNQSKRRVSLTLILENDAGDRLQSAFAEALPGKVVRLPTYAAPDDGLAHASRWRLCVGHEIGRRIKLQGWRDGLIYAVTREEFERVRLPLGPRDALLFHDVPPARLRAAVTLAIAGMTLFPPEFVPEDKMAGPALQGFEQLIEFDRAVMAELALGLSNQQIAARLGYAPERVRQSVNRIFRKLGCLNRTEVAVLAYGRFSAFLHLPDVLPQPSARHEQD